MVMNDKIKHLLLEHKQYPIQSMGYGLFYITKDGGALCPKCANGNKELTFDVNDSQWHIVAVSTHWECYKNGSLFCDHCGNEIEPEYGYLDE